MKKFLVIILIFVFILQVRADDLLISSVTSFPQQVSPGESVELLIFIENIGERDLKNIAVKLDLLQVPFAPKDSAAEFIIKELDEDEKTEVRFNLLTLPNAEPGVYKIPLEISYDNIIKKTVVSLTVQAKPQLFVEVERTDILYAETTGNIIIKFVNKGLSNIKFLTVTLQDSLNYEILSSKTVYIGNVDVDDTENAEFKIFLKEKSGELPLKIEYRDANNNVYRESKIVSFNIYTKEEAEKLGLVKKSRTFIYLTIVLVVVILFIILRTIRKKQ